MALVLCKNIGPLKRQIKSLISRRLHLVCVALLLSFIAIYSSYGSVRLHRAQIPPSSFTNLHFGVPEYTFLEVPQITWGLNNQKIAFARACLTARMLKRTLLMPSLSASLFYKEVDLLEPIAFHKIFNFDAFNSLCNGFVQLGRYSNLSNRTPLFELRKGSGRKWTRKKDLDQLEQFRDDPAMNEYEVVRIMGKNPFLWHDHWPVKDYAKIFKCLVLVDEIGDEAAKVVLKIRERSSALNKKIEGTNHTNSPYIAVHMRIEKDWMIHCRKLEQRSNKTQICSSKAEIMDRVSHIRNPIKPVVVYLAVADSLLEDSSILNGWSEGLHPFEKKSLGVWEVYNNYSYLIQSAIDYEVCLRSDVFVGNSFSTFSSLVVLERTLRAIEMDDARRCKHLRWVSYAYNILGEFGGPQRWMTNMSDSSLDAISYGSNNISC